MSQPLLLELETKPPTPPPPPGNSTPNRALPGSQTEPDTAQPAQGGTIGLDELVSRLAELESPSSAQMVPSKARTAANPARQSSPSQNG
jgi:hypothetical protein